MLETRPSSDQLILHGIVGGVVAGIIFIIGQMVVAPPVGGSFFEPLRLIASMVLGTQALDPTYPLIPAVVVGLVVHLILSAVYGLIFVYLLTIGRQLDVPGSVLLLYGWAYGWALWVLNYRVIAPIVWPQFTGMDQLWPGILAHTFFFGVVLGGYVAAALRQGRPEARFW